MGQVTIYVEDSALQAARAAASRAQISLSQWFGQFAIDEKKRQSQSWSDFFAELDALKTAGDDDFPDPETLQRHDVPDLPREPW